MKKLINIIFILFLFPVMVSGQELIELYKKGEITLNPDPQFSINLKETPVKNEISKFNDWFNSEAFGLERKDFIKDFAISQEGDLYLLGSYSRGVVFKFDKQGNYISRIATESVAIYISNYCNIGINTLVIINREGRDSDRNGSCISTSITIINLIYKLIYSIKEIGIRRIYDKIIR